MKPKSTNSSGGGSSNPSSSNPSSNPSPINPNPTNKQTSNLSTTNSANSSTICCTCKSSRCIQMYCECFARGTYCDSSRSQCSCQDCHNRIGQGEDKEKLRFAALQPLLNKLLLLGTSNQGSSTSSSVFVESANPLSIAGGTTGGCKCQRSKCLKKYCDCFQAGKPCDPSVCECKDCENCSNISNISTTGNNSNSASGNSNGNGIGNSILQDITAGGGHESSRDNSSFASTLLSVAPIDNFVNRSYFSSPSITSLESKGTTFASEKIINHSAQELEMYRELFSYLLSKPTPVNSKLKDSEKHTCVVNEEECCEAEEEDEKFLRCLEEHFLDCEESDCTSILDNKGYDDDNDEDEGNASGESKGEEYSSSNNGNNVNFQFEEEILRESLNLVNLTVHLKNQVQSACSS